MTAKPKPDPVPETAPAASWQANDIFDVIRRLVNETGWTGREKDMANALVDAHGSQHVANTELFHDQLAIHGGLLGLPSGSPQLSKALADHRYPAQET